MTLQGFVGLDANPCSEYTIAQWSGASPGKREMWVQNSALNEVEKGFEPGPSQIR